MDVGLHDYVAGAALTTDLVLTEPGLRLGDRLTATDELGALLDQHGLEHHRVTRGELTQVRALREELLGLFAACDAGELVDRAGRLLANCPHRVVGGAEHVGNRRGDWRLQALDRTTYVQHLYLITGAAALATVHALGPDRFRQCAAGDLCIGKFVDTSNPGRRRFCLPKVCGNRVNVARYRARQAAR